MDFDPHEVRQAIQDANLRLKSFTLYRDVISDILRLSDEDLVACVRAAGEFMLAYPEETEESQTFHNLSRPLKRTYDAIVSNIDKSANAMRGKSQGGKNKTIQMETGFPTIDELDFDM